MRFVDMAAWAGELCFYLGTVGFLLSPAGDRRGMLLCLAGCLLAGWACAWAGKWRGAARYLPLLLLAPLAVTGEPLRGALRIAPVLLLALLRCRRGQWRAEYYTVQGLFRIGGAVYALLAGMFLAAGELERLARDSLPFFVAWLLLTVLALRLLRTPYAAGLDWRNKALHAALLAGVAAAVAALSSEPAVNAALAALRALWDGVVGPVAFVLLYAAAMALAAVCYAVGYLIWAIAGGGTAEMPEMDMGGMTGAVEQMVPEAVEPSRWFIRAAAAAGVALFLFLAWRVALALVSPAPPEAGDTGALRRETLPQRAKRAGRAPRRAQAEGVREVYRKYLALCASLGIPVDGSAASDVIAERSAPYTGVEDAEALREQWLRARFSGRETRAEDVKRARQSLRRMREAARARRAVERRSKTGEPDT